MSKLRTALLGAAALGALALSGQAANATLYVFYSTDNGLTFTAVNPGGSTDGQTIGSFSFASGSISIGTSSFSNNAPNPGGAPSFTSNAQLTASNSSSIAASIEFAIVDNGFQGPTAAPFSLSNAITLLNNVPVAGTTVSQDACVNNNALVPTTGNVGSLCSTSPNKDPTASLTSSTATGSIKQTTTASIATLGTPFTIGEFFTLNLAPGDNVNAQGSATLASSPSTSVPEPASLTLLVAGLFGLGAAGMRRKS